MARQGRLIESLAVTELERRRNQLEEYQIKARFALAESYDRASKKQSKAEKTRLIEAKIRKDKLRDKNKASAIELPPTQTNDMEAPN
jgi:hypothetical protein